MNAEKWHHSEIRIAINDESQGSVATRLECGGVFVHDFVTNFLLSLTVKEFLIIGQYLVKLWPRVWCVVFLTHGVECVTAARGRSRLLKSGPVM